MPGYIRKVMLLAVLAVVLVAFGAFHYEMISPIVYEDKLDSVAVTVDGDELTLRDLSFYVLYEEQTIETEAMIYNSENTRDFWNLHANGIFFKFAAKKYVMDMAVHDYLMYKGALEAEMTLTDEEQEILKDSYNDFLDDLLLQQKDSGLYDEQVIYETMERIALSEKYRGYLADRDETTYGGYGYDGRDYQKYLKDHKVKINHRIWDRVAIGDNSLVHKSASGVNGQESEDE